MPQEAIFVNPNSARNTINRARSAQRPAVPRRISELQEILINFQPARAVFHGVITDSNGDQSALFMSEEMIQRFNNINELHLDGTFRAVPNQLIATQLLILFIRRMDVVSEFHTILLLFI